MREPERIRLFYVIDSDVSGEDRSLLVRETTLPRVLKAWRAYYELTETTLPARIVVVPCAPLVGPIAWGNCVDVYPLPKSKRALEARKLALAD